MTNAEKYKKEINAIENRCFAVNKYNNNKVAHCDAIQCEDCLFRIFPYDLCDARRVKWLISEHEDVLRISRLEYEILKYLSRYTNYKYIAKDKDFMICVYATEPKRKEEYWERIEPYEMLDLFKEAFLFLDWEDEPMLIDNILERAKVIENE